jgi:hypothetical protein
MKIVECDQLAEGKTVMIGDIVFVGTKNFSENKNEKLLLTKIAT